MLEKFENKVEIHKASTLTVWQLYFYVPFLCLQTTYVQIFSQTFLPITLSQVFSVLLHKLHIHHF